MQLKVEVKQSQGEFKSGVSSKTGKPYCMADQEVAVFVPGEDYPVVMRADVAVPDKGELAGKPQWYKPGIYMAKLKIGTNRFGGAECRINFRGMQPAAPVAVSKAG